MTTRDSRSRPPERPETGREGSREPTQSLEIDIGEPSHPSLAVGTSDVDQENRTKVESPGARHKTPLPRDREASKPPPLPGRGPDDPETRIGSVLGTYKVAELLGKGGMGYVFRAEHVKLGREVALKLLRGDYARRRDAVLRFFQEAKTVNRVRHRNIVDVTDFVELDDGTTFIIMELLRGQSLGKWARTGIDLPRALAVLVQICDGLGAAHAVGVVHRDLKPDNVIVVPTSDGAELVKLLDFGVAKLVNRDDEDIGFQTAAGSVIGTPAYMSPEQAGGMAVDHRSDIYSLGAIMYELFCGQPMFRGRSFGEYVRKHLTEVPVPPRQTPHGANLDERLEALILKCLAKDPNERFGHILELRDGLLYMLGGIDTHPPTYASLAQSAVRPPMTHLTPHMLPLAPGMVTTVPTPPYAGGRPSTPVPGNHPSQLHFSQLSGHYSQLDPPVPPPTPVWVWVLGGACAVALGIGAAFWYAGRSGDLDERPPAVTAKPQPTAAPIETPPPAQPQLVELQFDSLPSGGVYEAGRSAEKCRTPCAFEVNVADGGPQRTFVVRSDGYRDASVQVDLASTQRVFHVTLDRVEPAVPTVAEPPIADADKPTERGKHPARPTGKKPVDKKPVDKPVETAEKPDDKKPDDKKPDDKKPDDKKPDDKKPGHIDQTDTLDPFHRHP